MRRWVLAIGAATVVCGPTALAFFSGGYFGPARLIAGIATWALVVLAVLLTPRPLPSSTAGRVALSGLALLAAWTALSIAWAPPAGPARPPAGAPRGGPPRHALHRLLLSPGFFSAATPLLRGAGPRRWLEPAAG